MNKKQIERLNHLKSEIKNIDKNKINIPGFIIDLDNELLQFYFSLPLIFPNDFKQIGIDVIHNKTKKEFMEICSDFLGLNEFAKCLIFYNQGEIDKRVFKFDIEVANNLKKIEKNLKKIINN